MTQHARTLIDEYLVELRDLAYSPHTVKAYRRFLYAYAELLKTRHRSPCSAGYKDVVAYRRSVDGAHATVRLALSAVRGFHAWLQSTGQARMDPARAVKSPRRGDDEHVKITHTRAAIRALHDAAIDPVDQTTLALLYGCALRVSEAASLPQWHVAGDASAITIIGKGRKRRDLWVPDDARDVIAAQLVRERDNLYLLPPRNLRSQLPHVHPATLDRRLRDIARRAGLDPARCNPHSLRHARAEHMRADGIDLAWISGYLGHEGVAMTVHYTNPPIATRPAA